MAGRDWGSIHQARSAGRFIHGPHFPAYAGRGNAAQRRTAAWRLAIRDRVTHIHPPRPLFNVWVILEREPFEVSEPRRKKLAGFAIMQAVGQPSGCTCGAAGEVGQVTPHLRLPSLYGAWRAVGIDTRKSHVWQAFGQVIKADQAFSVIHRRAGLKFLNDQ